MTIEEFKNKYEQMKDSNIYKNYCSVLENKDLILRKTLKEKQELIDYLKDLLENRYTNSKVVWFDSEYAKIYGELCTMAGANDDRLPLVPLSEIENILSKIEKR